MQFIVYDKTGENIRCTTRKLEYSGTFMGECSVTMDITSPTPIDFHIGDYVEYRGERFEINYDPSVIKTARRETVGDAFKYENIKFNSLSDELVRADFLDYVSNDNNIHFTALPTFSFFCSDVRDLAQRIQANLDRVYTGSKKWTVSVHSEFVGKKDVSISVSNIKVWDALALASSDFDANFIIRGRTITIGTAGIAVGNMFSYGKNNGLFEIERSAEPDQAIITRLRAYGSEKNLPPRYYNKLSNLVPNNMAVTHLMLPDFPLTSLDPYIDSANITQLGIREGSVFFDGSNGNEEIYPSIEGMTYQGTNIDEVQSAEQTTDDGIWEVPEGETSVNIPNFTITLYDLGFDIRDYLIEGQNPVISMKSGLCAGREFEIVNVSQDTQTGYYTLECRRVEDSSLGLVFPYKDYNVQAGDKFVLLYISMPTEYITAAAQRLYDAAVAYLAKNDYVRYSYSPKVDNIFLQRQHDTAIANSDISIHDTIKEGDLLLFNDTDLGISGSIIIDQLTIKEGDELIPQYEITLRNDKTVGTIQRLQQQIDSIVSGATAVGGYNSQQIQSIMRAFGDVRYLRKDIDDVAKGLIDSLKGFQVGADFVSGLLGEGGIFRKEADGKTYIEADRLYVRMKAYFDEIEVKKYTHSGGNRIASKTGVKTVKVEWLDANGNVTENASEVVKYRCYFRLEDDDGNTITNDWVVGDLARSQEFKDGTNGYWRAVVGVGTTPNEDGLGYIDLSKSDSLQDSDIPQAQDDIIQLGNKTVTDRQGAIIEYSTGANAPSYQIYQGINDYNLNGKNYVTLGYNSSTGKAELIVYGDAFIGNQNGSHIQYNSTTGNLTIKATIDAQSTIGNQSLEEYIQEHQTTWTEQEIETLITDSTSEQFADIDTAIDTLQKQADGAIETWFYNGEPTLSNEPASTWTTTELKDRHLGDLYYDNSTGYAYRFTKTESTYSWNPISDSAVAKALSDAAAAQTTANSKRRIFFVTPTPPYEQGDLWVNATYPANNTYTDATNNRYYNDVLRCKTTKASGSFSISDWTLASKYTDDSKFNSYIDQLLNHTIISNPSDAQQVANTYNSVMQALNQGTIIEGGLVLSTLIGLRDSNNKVWSGISGTYNTQAKGNGIASWYGGAMVDWETLSDAQKQAATDGSYAKSLFRMDGTGYMASGNISWDADGSGSVAGGNISWDANGRVTLKNLYTDTGKNIDQLLALFSIGGTIPTNAYITPAYPFSDLQVLTNSGNAVSVKDYLSLFIPHYNATTGELESIESPVPLWSRGEVSALGYDGSGGGGSGDGASLAAVWTSLGSSTGTYGSSQINASHLTTALNGYATQSWVNQQGFLKSYTETDPVFTASAAYGITSSDITSWNSKPSRLHGSMAAGECVRIQFNSGRYTAMVFVRGGKIGIQLVLVGTGYGASTGGNQWMQLSNGVSDIVWSIPKTGSITKSIEISNTSDAAASIDVITFDGDDCTITKIDALTTTGINNPMIDADSVQTLSGVKTFSAQIKSTVATGTSPLVVASSTLVSKLNADLLDGVHASGLFTSLTNSGNNISVTIGGTNMTLQVAHADTSSAVGELKYIYFTKNDNSGNPMLLLVSDVSEWYSKTSTSSTTSKWFGMIGNLIAWRTSNMARNYNCRFVAAVSYYNAYYRLQSDNSWVKPMVVSYDSKYYLAIKLTGPSHYCYFLGYTNNLLDTFIKLDYPSATALPSGVEIIYEGGGIPYQATSITASSTVTVEGLLTANGNIKTDSYIEIGDYRIVADTANTALKVVHKNGTTAVNFYATGENSALGVNTSGGGGGDGASLEAIWQTLKDNYGTYKDSQINIGHLTNALNGYATQSWVNQQGFLKSYTETDPVFTASAAYGITSTNISTWNNKQDAISDLATIRSNASAGAAKVSNVQADWTATSGLAVILHKPTLATVATSGKYSDLTGTPTKVSDFTNDANYVTSSSLTTTLASYATQTWVTNKGYATTSAMNTALSGYLPLTGGTLSGNLSIERTGTTDSKVTVTNGNGSVSLFTSTNRGIYDDDNSKWLIGTNGTNSFLMDGNVGIGTASPTYKLHVNGAAYVTNLYLNGENRFTGSDTQLVGYIGNVATLIIEDSVVRRGFNNANIILGTSTYRWANLYSVLGNFSGQITSSVATGTSPLSVASTTLNTNLNADLLDGYHATELARLGWNVLTTYNSTSPTSCVWREIDAPATSSHRVVYDIASFAYGYPYISYYRLTLFSYSTTHLSVSLVNLGTSHRSRGQSRICVGVATDGKVYIQNGSIGGYNFLHVRNILSTDGVNAGTIHTESVGEAAFGTANGFTAAKIITDTGYCRINRNTGEVDTSGDPSITTSLRIGDACIWWDETNNCLRITGANANGLRSTSVAVNVNVSGEISALKTS